MKKNALKDGLSKAKDKVVKAGTTLGENVKKTISDITNQPIIVDGHTVLRFKGNKVLVLIPDGYEAVEDKKVIAALKDIYGLKQRIEDVHTLSAGNSVDIVTFFYPEKNHAMDFNNLQGVIDGIHECLADHQGLIEAKSGKTKRGYDYIYSIVKSVGHGEELPTGIQYFLRMNIGIEDKIIEIYGSFEEQGTTGLRESIASCMASQAGIYEMGGDNWSQDPYDPNYKKGICKNLAEKEGLDGLFPYNPLSQAREFLLAVINDELVIEKEESEEDKESQSDEEKDFSVADLFVDECRRYTSVVEIEKGVSNQKDDSDNVEVNDDEIDPDKEEYDQKQQAQRQEKVELLRKYAFEIGAGQGFYVKGFIPEKAEENAIKTFANGVDKESIIGLYDTSMGGSGKSGYLFTDTKVYYLQTMDKPKKMWYDDIKSVEVTSLRDNDYENSIVFNMYDEDRIEWKDRLLNKTPLARFFTEMIELVNDYPSQNNSSVSAEKSRNYGAIAGGIEVAAYQQVNKSFDEERFHAEQGHGFAAERANDLYDRLTGHKAKIVGDDNIKNGPDRMVDGVQIQSKYYQTGRDCINACFDTEGNFRYMVDGKPMQIEVPSNKFDYAVRIMEQKIKDGKIPGVTDPNDAKNIVRKGHFTYEQARNIAKAGNVDSLKYDAANGAIISLSAFGVTATITLATSLWRGEDFNKSMELATYSGLKVGGTAFITTVIAGQLSKAGLNSALVSSSEAVVDIMGFKASAVLANAFRHGSSIHGAAAAKSAAKILRGSVISAGVTVVVLSSVDIANIFRGRISGKQLFKNLTNTATTVAGGTGGWLGGAAIGSAILPGAGTVVGGLIGSVAAGAAAGKATNFILDSFIEDDADEMVRIIQNVFEGLAVEYILSQKEAEKSIDKLKESLDGKTLKSMFASEDRDKFARDLLVPIIENETKKRRHIEAVSDDQITQSLRDVLESISDATDSSDEDLVLE